MKPFLIVTLVMLSVLVSGVRGTAQEQPVAKATWETVKIVPPQAKEKYYRIAFVDRKVGYLASNKAIYKTEDGCLTWKTVLQANFLNSGHIAFLQFKAKNTGWLGCNGTLYATDDGGESWAPVEKVPAAALAVGPDGWMLAGGGGSVFRKSDPKAKWEKLDFAKKTGADENAQFNHVALIAIAGKETAFVAINGNLAANTKVFKTTDRGKTWKEVFKRDLRLEGLQFVDGKRGWLIGSKGIWATQDGGESWNTQLNPEDRNLRFLAFDPKGSPVGVAPVNGYGGDRKILYTTNGKAWRSVELDLKKAEFICAAVVDSGCAYILTNDGRFIRFLEFQKKS